MTYERILSETLLENFRGNPLATVPGMLPIQEEMVWIRFRLSKQKGRDVFRAIIKYDFQTKRFTV